MVIGVLFEKEGVEDLHETLGSFFGCPHGEELWMVFHSCRGQFSISWVAVAWVGPLDSLDRCWWVDEGVDKDWNGINWWHGVRSPFDDGFSLIWGCGGKELNRYEKGKIYSTK